MTPDGNPDWYVFLVMVTFFLVGMSCGRDIGREEGRREKNDERSR